MATCKQRATTWVHRYAAGGAAFAAIPLPTTSAGLVALETHLFKVIGDIYGDPPGAITGAAAASGLAIGGQALKWAAMNAAMFVPGFGTAVRVAIAGVTIEGLGHGIIEHYERKYPGKS